MRPGSDTPTEATAPGCHWIVRNRSLRNPSRASGICLPHQQAGHMTASNVRVKNHRAHLANPGPSTHASPSARNDDVEAARHHRALRVERHGVTAAVIARALAKARGRSNPPTGSVGVGGSLRAAKPAPGRKLACGLVCASGSPLRWETSAKMERMTELVRKFGVAPALGRGLSALQQSNVFAEMPMGPGSAFGRPGRHLPVDGLFAEVLHRERAIPPARLTPFHPGGSAGRPV